MVTHTYFYDRWQLNYSFNFTPYDINNTVYHIVFVLVGYRNNLHFSIVFNIVAYKVIDDFFTKYVKY